MRFAQNQTLSLPKTGQAVTLDIGSLETIHPPNKKEVGERLARWALAKDYKQRSLFYSGPVCTSAKISADEIILDFNIGAELLVAAKSGLKEFAKKSEYKDKSEIIVCTSEIINPSRLKRDRCMI